MKKTESCGECGMTLNDPVEYHPYTFCLMVKAGVDPWQLLADTLWHRGWEKESVSILRRFSVREMNHHERPVASLRRRTA